MVKEIKSISAFLKNGVHDTFDSRNGKIYVFQVLFTDGKEGRCGSVNASGSFNAGDKVQVNVLKAPKQGSSENYLGYLSLKKFNEQFNSNAKNAPVIQNKNTEIAIASVNIAFNVFVGTDSDMDFKDPEFLKGVKKVSMKIADVIVGLNGYLDTQNK